MYVQVLKINYLHIYTNIYNFTTYFDLYIRHNQLYFGNFKQDFK
jgi:hypothetical protein